MLQCWSWEQNRSIRIYVGISQYPCCPWNVAVKNMPQCCYHSVTRCIVTLSRCCLDFNVISNVFIQTKCLVYRFHIGPTKMGLF